MMRLMVLPQDASLSFVEELKGTNPAILCVVPIISSCYG